MTCSSVSNQKLKDKVAIITGSSRGMGRASALLFAQHGAKVVVNFHGNKEAADQVVRIIEEGGGSAIAIQADTPDLALDAEFTALAHLLSAGSLHRLQDRKHRDEHLQRALDLSLNPEAAGPLDRLNPRERRIARLVARGMRNRDIGAELNIGEGTVKVYLHAIYQKLGIDNRTELALLAVSDTSN